MSEIRYTTDFNYNNKEYQALVDVSVEHGYDGIGPYEFWGHKGFDKGNPYAQIDQFEVIGIYYQGEEVPNWGKNKQLISIVENLMETKETKEEIFEQVFDV